MPQGPNGTSKSSKINERLGNPQAGRCLAQAFGQCERRCAVRKLRVKEVREFPIDLLVSDEVGAQKLSRCFERQKP